MSKHQLVYGIHVVTALLQNSPHKIQQLWLNATRTDQKLQHILQLANAAKLAVQQVPPKTLDKLVTGQHQGVIAEVTASSSYNEDNLPTLLAAAPQPLLLILDGIEDPHNLGACLRTANASGVTAVIAPKDRAVGITPTVSKVACGAAETTPFVQVTNLARTLKWLQEQGIWLYGAASEAEQTLYQLDLTGPMAIVLGAEGSGLRRLTCEHCDYLMRIPMSGTVSSLNVSVATGICLFEVVRQRSLTHK